MSILEKKIDALMRYCTAETDDAREKAQTDLREIMKNNHSQPCGIDDVNKDLMIRRLLLELGVPDHLPGWMYLSEAIAMVVDNRDAIIGITKNVYAQVAEKHRKKTGQVEKQCRYAIEVAWTRADMEVLRKYFGGIVDPTRGKPTLREFIVRVANNVRTEV